MPWVNHIMWRFEPFSITLLIAGAVAIFVAILVWFRRSAPGSYTLMFFELAVALWAICDGIQVASYDMELRVSIAKFSYIGIYSAPTLYLMFVLTYTGRKEWLTKTRLTLLWLIPIAAVLLAYTNEFHHLIWTGFSWDENNPLILHFHHGPVFWVITAYAYLVFLVSTFLLIRFALTNKSIYRYQSVFMVLATLTPFFVNVMYLAEIGPNPGRDYSPVGFMITGLFLTFTMIRYRLFDLLPVARDALLDNMSDAVLVLDSDNRIVYINETGELAFSLAGDQAIGRNVKFELVDWPILLGYLGNMSGFGAIRQTVIQGPDGHWYDLKITAVQTKPDAVEGWMIVLRDITSRKKTEEELRQQEELYRNVAEKVNDGIVIIQNDIICYSNLTMSQILGYLPEELLGSPLVDLIAPTERELIAERARRRLSGEQMVSQYQTELISRWGEVVPVEVNVGLMEYENDAAIIATVRDVTDRKQAEEEIHQYANQQKLLNQITTAAIKPDNFDDMLQILADRMVDLLEADGSYISLWDEHHNIAVPMAASYMDKEAYREQFQIWPGESTFTEAVLENGEPMVINDLRQSPLVIKRILEKSPTVSMLALPLLVDQIKLGAVLVSFDSFHAFSEQEIELGMQASSQIALAVLKAKLLQEEREQREIAEVLQEMGIILSSTLNTAEVLTTILRLIKRIVDYDTAAIMEVDGNEARVIHSIGADSFGLTTEEYEALIMKIKIDEIPNYQTLVQDKKPVIVADKNQYEGWVKLDEKEILLSWLGIPVIHDDKVVAILSLDKEEPNYFNQKHANNLLTFASQAAFALQNSRLYDQMQELAAKDPLTEIFNRRYFFRLLKEEFQRVCRYNSKATLIMIDIDHFKKINDKFGHQTGDIVLLELATQLKNALRQVDVIARYGGEEFIILAPEISHPGGKSLANRLRDTIKQILIETEEGTISITASFGVTEFDHVMASCENETETIEKILKQADVALYTAKHLGRDQVVVYRPGLETQF